MGFWPFGREPSEVEIASRVVTAPTRDRFTVRGKLTLHFLEPQTQAAADGAADRCVELCAAILREAPDHRSLISGEATVVSELVARLPPDFAPTRAIELVSLHVVGDPGPSAAIRRPSSGAMAAVKMPGPVISSVPPNATSGRDARPLGETSGRDARPPGETSWPIPIGRIPTPPPATASPIPRVRRASSTRMRAVSLVIPPSSPPPAMGAAVVPFVRDSAARLLVGTLRAFDLLVLRRVTLDESSPEMLSALVPISEVAPGAYESSRAQELGRWQGMLGPQIFAQLQRDACVLAVYLAYAAMIGAMVPQPLAPGARSHLWARLPAGGVSPA